MRGHEIITDLSKPLDILVLSERADLGRFSKIDSAVPIIFDLIDGYLAQSHEPEDLLRGVAKVVSGQISGWPKRYTSFIEKTCLKSAAVVCSSPEQELLIQKMHTNIHVILDCHDEIPLSNFKPVKISLNHEKRIMWEGLPATLSGLSELKVALQDLNEILNIQMDLVTDLTSKAILGKYLTVNSHRKVKKLLGGFEKSVNIFDWSISNLTSIATESSLSVLPINLHSKLQNLKPENRLLIMWKLGLPCLTSDTPAYARVSKDAGLDFICRNTIDWQLKIKKVLTNNDYAENMVIVGQKYLKNHHNSEQILQKWDNVMASVI